MNQYYHTLVLRILIPFIISYEVIQQITLFLTINVTHIILKTFNHNIFLIGDFLSYNDTYVKFVPACAAASAYFLLLLLTIFTKDIKFYRGLKIFLIGSLTIFTINIIRIIILILILDNYSLNFFKTVHNFFWSIIASVLVAFIWIYLTKKYKVRSIPFYSDLKYLFKKIKVYK